MKVEFVNPFIEAAFRVLETEVQAKIQRGALTLQSKIYTSQDVTTLVAVTGKIRGLVLYSMSEKTALALVEVMLGQHFPMFDDLAQSGIAELGNVVTGAASTILAEAGYASNIAPPAMIIGRGTMISTLEIQRLVVPLETQYGTIEVHVALRETRPTES